MSVIMKKTEHLCMRDCNMQ